MYSFMSFASLLSHILKAFGVIWGFLNFINIKRIRGKFRYKRNVISIKKQKKMKILEIYLKDNDRNVQIRR